VAGNGTGNESNPAQRLLGADEGRRPRSLSVGGAWRVSIRHLHILDAEALATCVATDRRELPPADGIKYVAFTDPSGGGKDAFTVAVAHNTAGRVVIDAVRRWPAPFNPSGVVAEIAALLKTYRVKTVKGDRYGGEFPRELFRGHGVEYHVSELDRSGLYLELLPLVMSKRIELPDDPRLLRELRGLERRCGSAGRDRVDHRPGEHDDAANVVAGVAHLAARSGKQTVVATPIEVRLKPFTDPSTRRYRSRFDVAST
jgi:hypothetical protein